MAGVNGKDVGDMVCAHCCLPIEHDEKWVQCAHCKEAKLAYTKLHESCVDDHRKENRRQE